MRRNTPGSNTWYLKAALNRMIFDQMDQMIDPRAARATQRMQQVRAREQHAPYFYKPGHVLPDAANP
jgi:hypothetical protein